MVFHYAYGKPIELVELSGKDGGAVMTKTVNELHFDKPIGY